MTMTPKPGYSRSRKYEPDIAEKILEAIEDGIGVTSFCETIGFRASTFHGWVADDIDDLWRKYARAKKLAAEIDFEKARDIAEGKHRQTDGKIEVMRDRLTVDTIKWKIAKLNPKVYGEASLLHIKDDTSETPFVPRTDADKDAARAAFLEKHSKGHG